MDNIDIVGCILLVLIAAAAGSEVWYLFPPVRSCMRLGEACDRLY